MRRWFIWILLLLLLVSVVAEGLRRDPGYVLMQYQTWVVETSFSVLLLLSLLAALVLLLVWKLLRPLLFSGAGLRAWGKKYSAKKINSKCQLGLIYLAEGEWQKAEDLLRQVAPESDTPLVYLLAAARAADARGDQKKRDEYLSGALKSSKVNADIAVGLTQAQLQFNAREWESCLATLLRIQHQAPKQKLVLRLLSQVYQKLEDWQSLKSMLPAIKKYEVLPASEVEALTIQTYKSLLIELTKIEHQEARYSALMQYWKSIAAHYRQKPELISLYVHVLLDIEKDEAVRLVIEGALKSQWEDDWVLTYGKLNCDAGDAQWNFMQKCLQQKPSSSALHLTLGRLALQRNEWDVAKEHFKSSLKYKTTSDAYLELARLTANLGDVVASFELQEKGLVLLNATLPVLPQPQNG